MALRSDRNERRSRPIDDTSRSPTASLRARLREATREAHDLLDARVSAYDLALPDAYARFLRAQLAARLSVEQWLARNAALGQRPPATVPLLIADLKALGQSAVTERIAFTPPRGADPLGAAWAIAGSHLGNRAILTRLRKAGGDQLPATFLSDPAMRGFWHETRSRLERLPGPGEVARAASAAGAVFEAFAHAFDSTQATALVAA